MVPFRTGPGINDARQIDRNVLADYATYLSSVIAPCGVCDISFRTEPRHGKPVCTSGRALGPGTAPSAHADRFSWNFFL